MNPIETKNRPILVAERDAQMREFVCDQLRADGFDVIDAATTRCARLRAGEVPAALIVLGALDSAASSLELVGELRAGKLAGALTERAVPVIACAITHDELGELRMLRGGCDDYVAMKSGYPLLRTRIDALLRRAYAPRRHRQLVIGELEVDRIARRVSLAGQAIEMSAKEFALLSHLAQDPTRVYTKEELLREVWGYQLMGSTRTLDSHASRLRRKLAPSSTRWIVNVWGVGYRLTDSVSVACGQAA